jgi:hypothetical protein
VPELPQFPKFDPDLTYNIYRPESYSSAKLQRGLFEVIAWSICIGGYYVILEPCSSINLVNPTNKQSTTNPLDLLNQHQV